AVLAMDQAGSGHEPTAQRFQQERAVAVAKILQAAEPAPRAEQQDGSCKLTIELRVGGDRQPVAGLVRVTNLEGGKFLSFAEEIHRDKNWYALAPGTVLLVPRARLKVEAIHGLETELATQELDLTARPAQTLSISLQQFYNAAAQRLRAGNTHLHLM